MSRQRILRRWASLAACAIVIAGCTSDGGKCKKCAFMGDITPKPLGTISDPIWQQQESNAEASDFVVHEHEWIGNSIKLNAAGVEHVKQIAARAAEVPFPIIVERSSMSPKAGTKYQFPVHGDETLDMNRRTLVVQALQQMGVHDAEQRVVVGPALTPGFQEFEGERAYNMGFGNMGGFGFGGMGGGFGGGLW
uniref:Lipoprotein n=1 Tax=Schlesneria paludicola TaxID=360056 RepID=A0A7C4QNY9_9PLAN